MKKIDKQLLTQSRFVSNSNRLFTIQFLSESWLLAWSVNNEDFQSSASLSIMRQFCIFRSIYGCFYRVQRVGFVCLDRLKHLGLFCASYVSGSAEMCFAIGIHTRVVK